MAPSQLISAADFCLNHQVEYSFIQLLHQNGLIEISEIEETVYIPESQLPDLERIVRLHYEMNINIEGIETITYLLGRIEDMQQEINRLKNRLYVYESSS